MQDSTKYNMMFTPRVIQQGVIQIILLTD